MKKKELRKLSRAELLELLLDATTGLQSCQERLAAAETALQNRQIAINKAGSIAEASLMLNGVFDAAQRACQQYSENIRAYCERQKRVCAQLESESRMKAESILAEAERKRDEIYRETQAQCAEMIRKAKAESESYWRDVSGKQAALYKAHEGQHDGPLQK